MAGNSGINVGFGTSGQALTSNGPGVLPTFQPIFDGGALILVQTKTASSATSLTFTTGISSTSDDYYLIFSNCIILAAAYQARTLFMQISNDGGSTYKATNYINGIIPGPTANTTGMNIATSLDAGANTLASGIIYLSNFTAANNKPSIIGSGTVYCSTLPGGTGANITLPSAIYTSVPISINALKISMTDSSAFSGIFSLYRFQQ